MPLVERRALDMAAGRTLDVGAGAGCHSLVLQNRGLHVTAIDLSPLAVDTMRQRGINAMRQNFFEMKGRFDTIIMLMNGIGIVGTLERLPRFFAHLGQLLAQDGQLLCDSSDISYVFQDDDGVPISPDTANYYGELSFRMQYRDIIGEPFKWLYIDDELLAEVAQQCGFKVEVVARGLQNDYLARITRNH